MQAAPPPFGPAEVLQCEWCKEWCKGFSLGWDNRLGLRFCLRCLAEEARFFQLARLAQDVLEARFFEEALARSAQELEQGEEPEDSQKQEEDQEEERQ